MRVCANASISEEKRAGMLYSDEEIKNQILDELSIAFAKELRKMSPLNFVEENIIEGTYLDSTTYKIEGIVISMETFQAIMQELKYELPQEKFEKLRNLFINTI